MLEKYKQKYPCEGHEFMTFLQGGLPSNWESVLPKFSQSDPIKICILCKKYVVKCMLDNQVQYGGDIDEVCGLVDGVDNCYTSCYS